MATYEFRQVDVFGSRPLRGNPLAVVLNADPLEPDAMQAFASWTGLAETTFLSAPVSPDADYRVRIFTPERELPFAGHPTLGSCHAWLEAGGAPRGGAVMQECGAGLVAVRRDGTRLAFAAPPLVRSGAVEADMLRRIGGALGIDPATAVDAAWVDNGPGWVAVMLATRAEVLALRPDFAALAGMDVGVLAPWDPDRDGTDAAYEVRAFHGGGEDPVTGSLNASLAQWLIGTGRAGAAYVARQGTVLGREGVVHVRAEEDGIWIGGETTTLVSGRVTF